LEGAEQSTCVDDGDGDAFGEWTTPAPLCRRVLCIPPHRDPSNGDVSCTNTNNEGSLCTYVFCTIPVLIREQEHNQDFGKGGA